MENPGSVEFNTNTEEKCGTGIDIQKDLQLVQAMITILNDIKLNDSPEAIELRFLKALSIGSREAYERFGEWMRIQWIIDGIREEADNIDIEEFLKAKDNQKTDPLEEHMAKQKLLVKDREVRFMTAIYTWLRELKSKFQEISQLRGITEQESITIDNIQVAPENVLITPFCIFIFVPDSVFMRKGLEGDAAHLPRSACVFVKLRKLSEVKFSDNIPTPDNFLYIPVMRNLLEGLIMPMRENGEIKRAQAVINFKSRNRSLERFRELEAPKETIREQENFLSGVYPELERPDEKVISTIIDIFHEEVESAESPKKSRLLTLIKDLKKSPLPGYEKQCAEMAERIKAAFLRAKNDLSMAYEKADESNRTFEAMVLAKILKPSDYHLLLKFLSA